MRRLTYDNAHDVQQRVSETLIKYRNCPAWAAYQYRNRAGDDTTIDLRTTNDSVWHKDVNVNDPEVDVRALQLGYFNKNDEAYYAVRLPIRRSRQGVCPENTYCVANGKLTNNFMEVDKPTIAGKPFAAMLMNEYPSLDTAIKRVAKNTRSIAISRVICLGRDDIGLIKFYYKNFPMGVFNPKTETFYLSDRFEHYKPMLKNHGIEAELT